MDKHLKEIHDTKADDEDKTAMIAIHDTQTDSVSALISIQTTQGARPKTKRGKRGAGPKRKEKSAERKPVRKIVGRVKSEDMQRPERAEEAEVKKDDLAVCVVVNQTSFH